MVDDLSMKANSTAGEAFQWAKSSVAILSAAFRREFILLGQSPAAS
jgi:hypothetical protein